jgi:hypothetical protein
MEAEYDFTTEQWIRPATSDTKTLNMFDQFKASSKLKVPGYHDKIGSKAADAFWAYPKDPYGRWHTCQRELFLAVGPAICLLPVARVRVLICIF